MATQAPKKGSNSAKPTTVSAEQRVTRRRALGRRVIKIGADLRISSIAIQESPDLQHLSDAEKKALDKAVKSLDGVATYLNKFGDRLDKK